MPPPAEVPIDIALVHALLEEQHPDLAVLPVVEASEGWDNRRFRVGKDLAVRMPRRAASAPLIEHEQRWLQSSHLTCRCPFPTRFVSAKQGADFPGRGA